MYDLHGQVALVTAAVDRADGVVPSVLDGIHSLEAEPGKAVLSTNLIALWGAFRLGQIPLALPGFGRLPQEP